MVIKIISQITPKTVLVVGDLILDRYTFGRTERISPEAPVPVVHVNKEETKAGGAGNVAINLKALGMRPRLVGRVGDDRAGEELLDILKNEGIDVSGVYVEKGCATPAKTRVIAGSQQVVRIDYEYCSPFTPDQAFMDKLVSQLDSVSSIAISDYAKGTLSVDLLRSLICMAGSIPTIADPKGTDFTRYSGVTVLKPNFSEALRAAGKGTLDEAARTILNDVDVKYLMVTRSQDGISLFCSDRTHRHFAVQKKEICDATGAGDTVLAMMSAAVACSLSIEQAIELSNIAAACSVERLGCARISLSDIADQVVTGNCSGIVSGNQALEGVLDLWKHEQVSIIYLPLQVVTEHLTQLYNLHKEQQKVVVCFEQKNRDEQLLSLLSSLPCVDLVADAISPFFPLKNHTMNDCNLNN